MGFSPIKPNIGGLKLKSNFSTAKLAANISANKSSAATMVKNGYSTYGTNLFFTPANRVGGGTPRYASASQLSRALNGTNVRYRGSVPSYSGVSYTQNVTQGMSSFEKGMAIASVGLTVLKTLGDLGIIGGAKSQGAVSNSTKLNDSFNNAFGSMTAVSVPVSTDVSATISAMENATDVPTLTSAISDADAKMTSISAEQGIYETAKSEEQSQLTNLQGQTKTLEKAQSDASQALGTQEQSVKAAEQGRDQVQAQSDQFGKEYSQATENYTKAHDATVNAQATVDSAKTKLDRADAAVDSADKQVTSAKTDYADAKAAYDSCPDTKVDASGNTIPNEPQKSQLKAKMNLAQAKLREAQKAKQNAETCRTDANIQLTKAKEQYSKAADAEKVAEKAKKSAAKNVTQNKDKLKDFEAKLDKEQAKLDSAKGKQEAANEKFMAASEALDAHQEKMESLTSATKLFEDTKNNISSLQSAITTQKSRLQQMVKDGISKTNPKTQPKPQGINIGVQNNKSNDTPIDGSTLPEVVVKGSLTNVSDQALLKMLNNPDNADQKDAITAELTRRGVKIQDGYGRKNAAGVDWSSMAIGGWNEYTS